MMKKKRILTLLLFLVVITIWVIWSNITIAINYVSVNCKNLPEELSGYKIAQISDLHNVEFGKNNSILLNKLEECDPDIIVITGDIVDANHTDYDVAIEFVKSAVNIAPCYYVTGNHEAWLIETYYELESAMVDAGVIVLHDEAVNISRGNASIQLIGLDDPIFLRERYGYSVPENFVSEKLETLPTTDGFTIMLSHRPELFDEYVDNGIDMVLTGHVHGGQFRVPLIGGLISPDKSFFPEYDAGVYTENGTTMIVSRGIGNSVIPIRINNRPEIVVVELTVE